MAPALRTFRRLGVRRRPYIVSSRPISLAQLFERNRWALLRRREHDAGRRDADGRAQRQADRAKDREPRLWPCSLNDTEEATEFSSACTGGAAIIRRSRRS